MTTAEIRDIDFDEPQQVVKDGIEKLRRRINPTVPEQWVDTISNTKDAVNKSIKDGYTDFSQTSVGQHINNNAGIYGGIAAVGLGALALKKYRNSKGYNNA